MSLSHMGSSPGTHILMYAQSTPNMFGGNDDLFPLSDEPLTRFCTPNKPDAAEVRNKQTYSRRGTSTPPSDIKKARLPSGDTTSQSPSDSAYASFESTPLTNKTDLLPGLGLSIFNKPICDDLKSRFLDIRILYTQPLWEAISSKRKGDPGDISMKLKYIGHNEADAQLYILVQCERRVSRKVKKFFAQKHVAEDLRSDFRVHVIDTAPLRLSTSDTIRILAGSGGPRSTLCGMGIEMSAHGTSRLATLGGMILAAGTENVIYGLTAGHPFINHHLSEEENESDSDDEDSEEDSDDERAHQEDHDSHDLKIDIGRTVANSFSSTENAHNYDWALIELDYEYWVPNCLVQVPETAGSVSEQKIMTTEDEAQTKDKPTLGLMPSETGLQQHLSEQSAVAITSRGLQQGTLTSNYSSLLMSPGSRFAETLDFLPHPGSSERPLTWKR